MEPLKRFTQCGSLTMLFAVFIVLFGVSSTALTTFGKSPPNPPPAPTQPPVKARECVSHNDCSSLRHTSCVRDGSEYRCLCGNNKPPLNGGCDEAPKQLRHLCQEDKHCDDDLICGYENVTRTTGFNRGQNTANAPKICLCDEGNGYTEDLEDNECNHVAASRDLNDYVITEKWRDVEQALPANTKILPILMAWGNARHEVKFKLKINKNKAGAKLVDGYNNSSDDANHDDKRYKQMDERRTRKKDDELSELLKRLINQGESIKEQLNQLRDKPKSNRPKLSEELKSPLLLFQHFQQQPPSTLPQKKQPPLQQQQQNLQQELEQRHQKLQQQLQQELLQQQQQQQQQLQQPPKSHESQHQKLQSAPQSKIENPPKKLLSSITSDHRPTHSQKPQQKPSSTQTHHTLPRTQQKPRSVTMLLQSLLNAGQQTNEPRPPLPPKSSKPSGPDVTPKKSPLKPKASPPDDELFLVIDNDRKNNSRGENNQSVGSIHVEYRQYCLNKKLDMAIAAAKATRDSCTNTSTVHANADQSPPPVQRSISRKLEFDVHRQNSFNKRLIKYLSENIRQRQSNRMSTTMSEQAHDDINAIHNEIDAIMNEIRALVDLEEELIKVYTDKCDRYRAHNNKYKTKLRLELCVDEVQRTLEIYAKEIIDSELKLYRIQNDIHDKCGRLYELQNVASDNVIEASSERNRLKNSQQNSAKYYVDDNKFNDSGAFVDSITDRTLII